MDGNYCAKHGTKHCICCTGYSEIESKFYEQSEEIMENEYKFAAQKFLKSIEENWDKFEGIFWDCNDNNQLQKTFTEFNEIINSDNAKLFNDDLSFNPHRVINAFNTLQSAIKRNNIEKGWRSGKPRERNFGETIALIHSELSEALEADRNNIKESDHIPAFNGIEEELADVIIRCIDLADEYELRLPEAILAKHAYNTTRPQKHGGKKY